MTKQKVESGNNSVIFQAENIYVDSDAVQTIKKIEHCGKCKKFYDEKKQDNQIYHVYEHCNELQKISNVETYLAHQYSKLPEFKSKFYIKPTLSISEYPFELGTSSYYTYEDSSFFLKDNYIQ